MIRTYRRSQRRRRLDSTSKKTVPLCSSTAQRSGLILPCRDLNGCKGHFISFGRVSLCVGRVSDRERNRLSRDRLRRFLGSSFANLPCGCLRGLLCLLAFLPCVLCQNWLSGTGTRVYRLPNTETSHKCKTDTTSREVVSWSPLPGASVRSAFGGAMLTSCGLPLLNRSHCLSRPASGLSAGRSALRFFSL